jgi:hypothetical protein
LSQDRPAWNFAFSHPIALGSKHGIPDMPPISWTPDLRKRSIISQQLWRCGAKRFLRPLPSNPNLDKQRKPVKALDWNHPKTIMHAVS